MPALRRPRLSLLLQDMAGGELLLLRWRPRLPRIGEAHAAGLLGTTWAGLCVAADRVGKIKYIGLRGSVLDAICFHAQTEKCMLPHVRAADPTMSVRLASAASAPSDDQAPRPLTTSDERTLFTWAQGEMTKDFGRIVLAAESGGLGFDARRVSDAGWFEDVPNHRLVGRQSLVGYNYS